MSVQFILGRAGTGKTHACLRAVADALNDPRDESRLLLLVPEQASFQTERAVAALAPGGGFWRAEVLSFSRLAQRVFDDTGRAPLALRPQARRMALRAVVESSAEARTAFGASAGTPGFLAELDRFIEELLGEGIEPAGLARAAAAMEDGPPRRRIQASAAIYSAYLDWLGRDRIDPAQRCAVARRCIEEATFVRDARVWIDGFAGFTGEEQAMIVQLARVARDMYVTALLDADDGDDAGSATGHANQDTFDLCGPIRRTIRSLRRALADARVPILQSIQLSRSSAGRFANAPVLGAIEGRLAEPESPSSIPTLDGTGPEPPPAAPQSFSVVDCETHRDEIRAAARFIRSSMVDANGALRYRDFALIARNLEPFWRLIDETFSEYGIPCFVDRRRRAADHALLRTTLALVDAGVSDCSQGAMSTLLTAGLLNAPRSSCEELEKYIRRHAIQGVEAWKGSHWPSGDGSDADSVRAAGDRASTVDLRRTLLASVELLRAGGVDARLPGKAWRDRLRAALERLGVRITLNGWIRQARNRGEWEVAETHAQAWQSLTDALDDFVVVFGERSIGLPDVRDALSGALAEASAAIAPPTLDQVLVASIERSRHPNVKFAWVFGFNDGLFPGPQPAPPLLRDADRDALRAAGLTRLRSAHELLGAERLLAYVAMTRASLGLRVSYSHAGSDGQPLAPSPLLAPMRDGATLARLSADVDGLLPRSVPEFAQAYLRSRADHADNRRRARLDALARRLAGDPLTAATVESGLSGTRYRNAPQPIEPRSPDRIEASKTITMLRRDSAHLATRQSKPPDTEQAGAERFRRAISASEIEAFVDCPFKHFARHRMRLEIDHRPDSLSNIHGNIAHAALAAVTLGALRDAIDVTATADAAWIQRLDAIWAQAVDSAVPHIATRRESELIVRLRALVTETLLAQAARWRQGEFRPAAAEIRLDLSPAADALPGLPIARNGAGDRELVLVGRIDRIDAAPVGQDVDLLVFDYKSTLRWRNGETLSGARLQACSYALALDRVASHLPISRSLADRPGRQRVAGLFLIPLYPAPSAASPDYFKSAAGDAGKQRMYLLRPRGVVLEAIAEALDKQLSTKPSPVADIRIKVAGGMAKGAAVAEEALRDLLDVTRRTLGQEGERILAGRIDIAPLLEGRTLACCRCDFRAVCRFDRALHKPRPASIALPVLKSSSRDTQADDE